MSQQRHYTCLRPVDSTGRWPLNHDTNYDPKSCFITLEEATTAQGVKYIAVWEGSGAYGINAQPDFDTAEKWLATKYEEVYLTAVTINKRYGTPLRIRP